MWRSGHEETVSYRMTIGIHRRLFSLLIKNFVAQMLAFERQPSPTNMDEDGGYENDYENGESDEYQMDSEDSNVDMENLKSMDNPRLPSNLLSTSPEDDIALSMVRRQNEDLYLVPGTSNEFYEEFSVRQAIVMGGGKGVGLD